MPILGAEQDIHPANLLDSDVCQDTEKKWWCVYTLSRREKDFMRKLLAMNIAFYGPVIPKRYRSPNGRLRTSYVPLFPNYVFMLANEEERQKSLTSNCIATCQEIVDREQLIDDLRQLRSIVTAGVALTPEAKLEEGNRVRVRTGPFAGYEGTVVRRQGKTRLLLAIKYLEQGVSMEMDEGLLEPLDR